MCGIAGCAGEHRERIERMTAALGHRGPDGFASYIGNGASLGHCRLAILDPRPAGDQPMWNDDRTIGIVYNGEIFNYRDLQKEENMQCRTGTDTEVIIRLYEKYGMDFVHRLRGMFAFGIYDTRTKTWHLARDTGGIKPLFLAYPKGELTFASEMRSLMAALPEKPALNMTALSQYLRLQYVPGPHTLCEGITQLPPGTILTWKDGAEERRAFRPVEKVSYASKDDFRERFPALMDSVVAQHLISDKPVGIFLSGGMDSSIVLHHMSNHAQKPIKTFTVRFDATKDEDAQRFNTDADLARKTAEHYGTDHHEILLTAELYRDLYKDTACALDQPNADSVSVAQFLLSREAKKHVDVVLTGAGGDELFGGYPRYRIARILQAVGFIPPAVRGTAGRLTGHPADVLRMQPGAILAERLLARPVKEGARIVRGDWFKPEATTALFGERFAALPTIDPVRAFMEFDRHLWLIDESLRLADATTMASGLEARVPFVDERIIAASHGTPAAWHLSFTQTKTLLKDAYRGILPDHLYTLKKASFYPPLAKWLRRETAPLAEAMLEHKRIRELFDTDTVRKEFEAHRNHQGYHLHTLSSLIQLSNWFDTVYDA
jgi:asparagine synthase (glutamine-hydrolysing)